MKFIKTLLVIPVILLLAAWSPEEINTQINETNVNIGNFCTGTIVDKERKLVVTAAHCTKHMKKMKQVPDYNPEKRGGHTSVTFYAPVDLYIVKTDMEGNVFAEYKLYGEFVAEDEVNDVALIKITTADVILTKEATLSKKMVKRGDKVFALGNPLMVTGSYSEGTVSKPKLGNSPGLPDFIPKDAIVFTSYMNKGSSGGALYNDSGELVGITDWGLPGGPYLASPVKNLVKLLESVK